MCVHVTCMWRKYNTALKGAIHRLLKIMFTRAVFQRRLSMGIQSPPLLTAAR